MRQRLADWMKVDVGSVTVGCGSVGLLQQLVLTYVDPGDEAGLRFRSAPWARESHTDLLGGEETVGRRPGDSTSVDSVSS